MSGERGDQMTTAATRGGSDRRYGEAEGVRMTELVEAFRGFAETVPGLEVEVVGSVAGDDELVHPVAGFHVLLPGEAETGVSLYVSAHYAELVRWRPGAGALRERFDVRLEEAGYGWGESTFPTAYELAHDLMAYMQFNVDALRKS
jgi:hypothetical protein